MTNRSIRAQIAHDTLKILDDGGYQPPSGRKVDIAEWLAAARTNSVLYEPEDFDRLLAQRDEIVGTRSKSRPTVFQVLNLSTLSAARRIGEAGHTGGALCLNFASARHPGGGFLNGSQAQEESLARSSGLYPCIAQMHRMYDANKRFNSCLYTDNMIYAPQVPVFRDDQGTLLDAPYRASFITAPAVNAGAILSNEKQRTAQIEPAMLRRIEMLLSVAIVHHHDTLVLGAWGCGVFKNSPEQVARWFHRQLAGNDSFRDVFKTVLFAILDNSREQSILKAFASTFA
jgi:uncharacterized protein (TIGR02452 family)